MATDTGTSYATQTPFGCFTVRDSGAMTGDVAFPLTAWLGAFQVRDNAFWMLPTGGADPVPSTGQLWPMAG